MKKRLFLLICVLAGATWIGASAQSVLSRTCYETYFTASDNIASGGKVNELMNAMGNQVNDFRETGLVIEGHGAWSEGRIYQAAFPYTAATPFDATDKRLDISLPSSKRLEIHIKVQGFDRPTGAGQRFDNYDNFLRFFVKSTHDGGKGNGAFVTPMPDGSPVEWVIAPTLKRDEDMVLVYDLKTGWHNQGDDCGVDGKTPMEFNNNERVCAFSIRPNNDEVKVDGVQFDVWGEGRITLTYLKLGDWILKNNGIELTANTAVNVNLANRVQDDVTISEINVGSGLPEGLAAAAGVITGTPTSTAATSVSVQIKYRQAGDTEDRTTVEKLYFRASQGSGVQDVKAATIRLTQSIDAIALDNAKNLPVAVYTVTGQKLYENVAYAGANIATGNWPSGVYVVKAGTYSTKFVKK